jgi:hypothetical protein
VRILWPVDDPAPHLAVITAAQLLFSRTVRFEPIRHDRLRPAMLLHRFLQKLKVCLAVLHLGYDAFQHLTLVIYGPPKIVRHPVDLHADFVHVPPPMMACAHRFHPSPTDLCGEHWTEPVPPKAHCFMTYLDAPFVQGILDVAQRQREPDVKHHCQADDLRLVLKQRKGERLVTSRR